jgi:manganese transport system permease protein
MLIIPGATAYLLTDRFGRMLVIAPAIAAVCSVVGLYSSYYLDASSGPMIVLAQGVAFALAYLFGPRHGLIAGRVAQAMRRRRSAPVGGSRSDVESA